tara:strand:- start:201 stop:1067 length:867 start_codon:yes stop_codon:yes gene_type:complete
MYTNTTGEYNVAMGFMTMYNNTTGQENTAIGYQALLANTTANNNTAVGANCLAANTTGGENTALGKSALDANTTGDNNTAVGSSALSANTTASSNVAVGMRALQVLTTGGGNTVVGKDAGQSVTTGDNNVLFGIDAGRSGSPSGNITTGSNNVCIGDNNISNAYIKVDWTVTSDRRDKTDIESFNHGLSWINKLKPVTYRWDNRSDYEDGISDGSKKGSQLNIGLIAQDELEVEREHGYGDTPDNMLVSHVNDDGNYGMQYSKLVPILVNAIKELSAEVEQLKSQLNN